MTKKTPVYLVVRPTGLFNRDGIELTVIIHSKTTRQAADKLAVETPGDRVEKLIAD